jgi:hypothetical protein
LALFVLRVSLADDPCHAVPLDHFAVLADRLHARADLHGRLLLERMPKMAKTLKIEALAGASKGGHDAPEIAV